MLYNRRDYLKNRCTHSEYYGQFVTPSVIRVVESSIGRKAIITSTDEHLNDIELARWDAISYLVPTAALALANGTAGVSLSDRVCVLKQAAQMMRESVA